MRYICNRCAKVFQANDITIHYTTDNNGLEIIAICQLCLNEYLEKARVNTDRKDDNTERMKMKRKW